MNTVTVITERQADEMYGYEFGVDGLMSMEQACEFLGGVSRDTIERLANDSKLRIGKLGNNRVRICRRSMREYIRSLEK